MHTLQACNDGAGAMRARKVVSSELAIELEIIPPLSKPPRPPHHQPRAREPRGNAFGVGENFQFELEMNWISESARVRGRPVHRILEICVRRSVFIKIINAPQPAPRFFTPRTSSP